MQDLSKAFKFFSLAAEQGWVDGQLQLGIMYYSMFTAVIILITVNHHHHHCVMSKLYPPVYQHLRGFSPRYLTSVLVLEQVQVLVLDQSSPTSLQFGLRTFFGPHLVHAQHLHKICGIGCSIMLPVASDKHPVPSVLAHCTGLLQRLVMSNVSASKCMYATLSTSKKVSEHQFNTGIYRVHDLVRFDQVQITDVAELGPVHLWPDRSITTLYIHCRY